MGLGFRFDAVLPPVLVARDGDVRPRAALLRAVDPQVASHHLPGRCRETWADAGRCGQMQGDMGRCREMWADAGRYGAMQGDMGRCREVQGDAGRCRAGGAHVARDHLLR